MHNLVPLVNAKYTSNRIGYLFPHLISFIFSSYSKVLKYPDPSVSINSPLGVGEGKADPKVGSSNQEFQESKQAPGKSFGDGSSLEPLYGQVSDFLLHLYLESRRRMGELVAAPNSWGDGGGGPIAAFASSSPFYRLLSSFVLGHKYPLLLCLPGLRLLGLCPRKATEFMQD